MATVIKKPNNSFKASENLSQTEYLFWRMQNSYTSALLFPGPPQCACYS